MNLYGFVGSNPISQLDIFGLKEWTCEETQDILNMAKTEGIIEAYFNHNSERAFDFKINQEGDTFDVDGEVLRADQFGNYVAGYGGVYAGGELGYWGVRAGGVFYDLMEDAPDLVKIRGTRQQRRQKYNKLFSWDADSVPDINKGADRARREIRDAYRARQLREHPIWEDANYSRNRVDRAVCQTTQ